MKADIFITFICITKIQRNEAILRFYGIVWEPCLKQAGLCDLYIIQGDVMQWSSTMSEGKEILFLLQ